MAGKKQGEVNRHWGEHCSNDSLLFRWSTYTIQSSGDSAKDNCELKQSVCSFTHLVWSHFLPVLENTLIEYLFLSNPKGSFG